MLRKITVSLAFGLIFAILFSFTTFANQCDNIREKVFRLHIIANSDESCDQQLKLKVRDRILKETDGKFERASDKEDAIKWAAKNMDFLKAIAQDEVNKNGCDDKVNIEIVNMYFPTKTYDEYTLPAGKYDALRITIGKAEGQNWWCVMFPQLCIPAVDGQDDIHDVFSDNEVDIVEHGEEYEPAFLLVEWFQKLINGI